MQSSGTIIKNRALQIQRECKHSKYSSFWSKLSDAVVPVLLLQMAIH